MKSIMEEIKDVQQEVGEVKDSVNSLRLDVVALPEKILEKTDQRYASKSVEKIVYFVGGVVITALIGSVMTLVLK